MTDVYSFERQTAETDILPLYWRGARTENKRTAIIGCPCCKKPISLSKHTINENGTVSPSVVCPHAGCNFHQYVMLLDWGPAPHK